MFTTLKPFLKLYLHHWFRISLGIVLAIATLFASIGLLSLSGWFLSASALAGLAALTTFNYMLPSAGVRGAAILRTASRYGERLISHDTTFRVLTNLRVYAFKRIIPLSPGGIARFRQAELLNRLVADIDTLDHIYLRLLSPFISAAVIIALMTWGLSWFDPTIALTLGGIMLLLLLIIPGLFYQSGKPIGIQLTLLRGDYRVYLMSWLQGQAELSIFGANKHFRDKLDEIELRWLHNQRKQSNLAGASQALMALASGLTLTLILWLAAGGVGDNVQPGALIALFVFAALAGFEALAPVPDSFLHLGQVLASAQRVNEMFAQQPEVTFPQQGPSFTSEVTLTLSNVTFRYPNQLEDTLQEIQLTIPAGQHVALLGRTGCGKSTLLQLINRAWDPKSGTLCINNIPLAAFPEKTLRQLISVVPQRAHIFSATLRANLLLAAPEATDSELESMLTQVGLQELLTDEGLNAWLGEGGRPLSGGEQCRIGVARALLHNAPLILLDEPTEGLDSETEQQIIHLIRSLAKDKTLIMVTHRFTGLEFLDAIYVMENGHIIEQGTHTTLLQQQGRYYDFRTRAF